MAELQSLISPIRKQLPQKRKAVHKRRKEQNPSVTILHVGRLHDCLEDAPEHIDYHVALFPFDLSAGVKP
jgi:hypothetical protein